MDKNSWRNVVMSVVGIFIMGSAVMTAVANFLPFPFNSLIMLAAGFTTGVLMAREMTKWRNQ